jgi:hypothetical protein
MVYKLVNGDFTATSRVRARRASTPADPPAQSIHLGGLIARHPTAAAEDYVFIVVGNDENDLSVETKTTTNGASTYNGPTWPSGDAELRICRRGATFRMLKRDVEARALRPYRAAPALLRRVERPIRGLEARQIADSDRHREVRGERRLAADPPALELGADTIGDDPRLRSAAPRKEDRKLPRADAGRIQRIPDPPQDKARGPERPGSSAELIRAGPDLRNERIASPARPRS